MKKRGVLYLRVSTDDQRDNGFSIESQLRMLREYLGISLNHTGAIFQQLIHIIRLTWISSTEM